MAHRREECMYTQFHNSLLYLSGVLVITLSLLKIFEDNIVIFEAFYVFVSRKYLKERYNHGKLLGVED